jgi:hypothetical protein
MIRATAITAGRQSRSLASCSAAAATTTAPDRIDIGTMVPAGVAVLRAVVAGMVSRLRRGQAVRAGRRRVVVMAAVTADRRRSKAAGVRQQVVRLRKRAVAAAHRCRVPSAACRRVVRPLLPRRMVAVAAVEIAASNEMGRCSRFSIESRRSWLPISRQSADMRMLRLVQLTECATDRRRHIACAGPTRAERQS